MTEGRKGTTASKGSKNLKLKKETLKDLDAKKAAKGVKGGVIAASKKTTHTAVPWYCC